MDIDKIFDAFEKVTSEIHREDAIRKKQAQINSAEEKRCGNCFHWMKSTCKPEKKNGHFKSCNSFPCKDFLMCPLTKKQAEKFKEELKLI